MGLRPYYWEIIYWRCSNRLGRQYLCGRNFNGLHTKPSGNINKTTHNGLWAKYLINMNVRIMIGFWSRTRNDLVRPQYIGIA